MSNCINTGGSCGKMKVIYIAGPYNAPTEYGVLRNILEARILALQVWQSGGVALCPHSNTAFFGGACPEMVWLDGYIELLRRCDALYVTHRWQESAGAVAEVAFARANDIPVLSTYDEMIAFLGKYAP